jgi:hypothetical protein
MAISKGDAVARDPAEVATFGILLQKLEEGQLHQELTEKIEHIVELLNDTRAAVGGCPKATITLKIGFKLEGETVDITGSFTTTEPKPVRMRTVLWTTPNNRLMTRNPRQGDLPLRDAGGPGVIRTA